MGRKIKWQSVKINFPKKLFFYAVWIRGDTLMPYYTNVLHKSFSAMVKDAKKTVKYYKKIINKELQSHSLRL